jgi:hypothetical protein
VLRDASTRRAGSSVPDPAVLYTADYFGGLDLFKRAAMMMTMMMKTAISAAMVCSLGFRFD